MSVEEAIDELHDTLLELRGDLTLLELRWDLINAAPKRWEQKTTRSGAYGLDPQAPPGDGWKLVGLLALANDPDDDGPMVYFYWQRELPVESLSAEDRPARKDFPRRGHPAPLGLQCLVERAEEPRSGRALPAARVEGRCLVKKLVVLLVLARLLSACQLLAPVEEHDGPGEDGTYVREGDDVTNVYALLPDGAPSSLPDASSLSDAAPSEASSSPAPDAGSPVPDAGADAKHVFPSCGTWTGSGSSQCSGARPRPVKCTYQDDSPACTQVSTAMADGGYPLWFYCCE